MGNAWASAERDWALLCDEDALLSSGGLPLHADPEDTANGLIVFNVRQIPKGRTLFTQSGTPVERTHSHLIVARGKFMMPLHRKRFRLPGRGAEERCEGGWPLGRTLTLRVLSLLCERDLCSAVQTSRFFHGCDDPILWKSLYAYRFGRLPRPRAQSKEDRELLDCRQKRDALFRSALLPPASLSASADERPHEQEAEQAALGERADGEAGGEVEGGGVGGDAEGELLCGVCGCDVPLVEAREHTRQCPPMEHYWKHCFARDYLQVLDWGLPESSVPPAELSKATRVKVVLVGAAGAGKTSLLHALGSDLVHGLSPTIGVSTKRVYGELLGQHLLLDMWDLAGEDRYQAIARTYFRGAMLALLVFNLSDRESLRALEEVWLEELREYGPRKLRVAMVGTHCDASYEAETHERASVFAREEGLPLFHVCTQNVFLCKNMLRAALERASLFEGQELVCQHTM